MISFPEKRVCGGYCRIIPIRFRLCPCEVLEESKAEAQRADFPQSGQKRPRGHVQGKSVYPRMACLLLHSEHAKHNEKLERIAAPPLSDVYLEAVETVENKSEVLMKLGLPELRAREVAYSQKAYWKSAAHASVQMAISSKRLAQAGYYSILDRYESLHLCD